MFPGFTTFFREKFSFLLLIAVWLISGMYGGPTVYVVIPISLVFMYMRGMFLEMLLGFFLILTLSDNRQLIFHFAVNVKDIYLLEMGILYFLGRQRFKPSEKLFLRFSPFLFFALLCMAFSPVLLTTAEKTLSYVLLLLVVPNFLVRAWRDEGTKALSAIVWWGTLLLLAGLMLKFVSPLFVTLEDRFTGILGNPNGLGLFCLVFFILFSIMRDIRKDTFTRWETVAIYSVIIISILYSGSRNALLTVFIFLLFRWFYRMSPFIGFFMLLVLIVSYQLITSNADQIIISLGLEDYFRIETLDNASGRFVAWNFGWDWIKKSPLIGSGIGFTDNLYITYYEVLSMMGHQGNAHNSYITFWLDTGVFGLASYLIGTFATFFAGAKRVSSAMPAMYAILFSAFFESWLTASLNPFTIQFVMVMTLISSPAFYEEPVPKLPENSLPEVPQTVPA